MPTYAVTVYDRLEFIDAETASKARWQAVRDRLEWMSRGDRKHLFSGVKVRKLDGAPYPLPPNPQEQADAWNAKHPVGTLVRYWRGVRGDGHDETGETRSPAQVLAGHSAVVWIYGCSGSIRLTHVEAI